MRVSFENTLYTTRARVREPECAANVLWYMLLFFDLRIFGISFLDLELRLKLEFVTTDQRGRSPVVEMPDIRSSRAFTEVHRSPHTAGSNSVAKKIGTSLLIIASTKP